MPKVIEIHQRTREDGHRSEGEQEQEQDRRVHGLGVGRIIKAVSLSFVILSF
jgi:hypothetical protein